MKLWFRLALLGFALTGVSYALAAVAPTPPDGLAAWHFLASMFTGFGAMGSLIGATVAYFDKD